MNKIYFATVWEDYVPIKESTNPNKNKIALTISSSGDNAFNLITDNIKHVYAIDFNPSQLNTAKQKHNIILSKDYKQALDILEGNEKNKGINYTGEFEKKALPILKYLVKKYFNKIDITKKNKNNLKVNFWLISALFIFSRKLTYKTLLHDLPINYINTDMMESLTKSTENFLKYNDFSKNWYLHQIMYKNPKVRQPYLTKKGFNKIKNSPDKITFIQADILTFLKKQKSNSIDIMNFSDIFDWCSLKQFEEILKEANRVLTRKGIIFYRELFVTRKHPKYFKTNKKLAEELRKKDNLPFYHRIVLLKK